MVEVEYRFVSQSRSANCGCEIRWRAASPRCRRGRLWRIMARRTVDVDTSTSAAMSAIDCVEYCSMSQSRSTVHPPETLLTTSSV